MDMKPDTEAARSDAQILAAAPVSVMLGGVEYAITPQPRKRTRVFRQKIAEKFEAIGPSIENIATAMVSQGGDDFLDLIYEYSPELAAGRDVIDETATDGEVVDALFACIMFAFGPFVSMYYGMKALMNVTKTNEISTNDTVNQ